MRQPPVVESPCPETEPRNGACPAAAADPCGSSDNPGGPQTHRRRRGPRILGLQLQRTVLGLGVTLALLLEQAPLQAFGPGNRSRSGDVPTCQHLGERHFDAIVYGDEPAGVMTALELQRQMRQLGGLQHPRIALLTSADLHDGLGGTLVRSGLAYLDRNQVPRDMWGMLPPFAPSSDLYRRFLQLTGVQMIAVDPHRASRAFQRALRRARITVIPQIRLRGAELQRSAAATASTHGGAPRAGRLCVLETAQHGRLGADLFIDASLGADLAHRAGVPFLEGLGGSLRSESLALGWIFEVEGLSVEQLRDLERGFTRRLLDRRDREAQSWLRAWPAYRRDRRRLKADLLEADGEPRLLFSSTPDSADQQSPAMSIAFHGEQGLPPGLVEAPALLDEANIAVLPGRLSFNALLFRNTAARNRALLNHRSRPLDWMMPVAAHVESFFLRHGARRVRWMPELYIRSADQIAHPVRPLSADRMAAGGVPRWEALGTFSYNLDLRGGLAGVMPPAKPTFNFGYRHTLPREVSNLAVLGPASGFAGLGEGAGRIIELNISVGQGLAIASTLAQMGRIPLAAVDPHQVALQMPPGFTPYGRPSGSTGIRLLLGRLRYALEGWWPRRAALESQGLRLTWP